MSTQRITHDNLQEELENTNKEAILNILRHGKIKCWDLVKGSIPGDTWRIPSGSDLPTCAEQYYETTIAMAMLELFMDVVKSNQNFWATKMGQHLVKMVANEVVIQTKYGPMRIKDDMYVYAEYDKSDEGKQEALAKMREWLNAHKMPGKVKEIFDVKKLSDEDTKILQELAKHQGIHTGTVLDIHHKTLESVCKELKKQELLPDVETAGFTLGFIQKATATPVK